MSVRSFTCLFCLVIGALACGGSDADMPDEDAQQATTRALLDLPDHFELPDIPEGNPLNASKIALGRLLFYDVRLSANGTQSCGSCHEQSSAFADGVRTPVGSTGTPLVRNSQGLANVAYMSTLTWAADTLPTLEDQIPIPVANDNPIELGVTDGVRDEVLARFDDDPEYSALFDEAFPESETGVTLEKVVFALASFCRVLISGSSPYDRYVRGDRDALTQQQKEGLALFEGERFECFHCHGGVLQTAAYHDANRSERRFAFFNTGLYNVDGEGGFPEVDQGLYDLTFNPDHRGLFRPPSLRNVELTGPYMHDGSIPTLREAVEHYTKGGRLIESGPYAGDGRLSPLKSGLVRNFEVEDEEIDAVVAFLESLTDREFIRDPAFSDPWAN